ncbi:class I SAM-dependent methyltransferase [Afipia sp. Root123D2]|uniref:class I SAM-dependent methyltransferase n=1 Tax=Afipia sp. Root123D2 TaxID=1736436 RepID=UPI0009EB8515|nr:class I SAM-dependent methyltransferase [Afipia sp. Root123D2]
MKNVDTAVAAGFGREWSSFSQSEQELSASERQKLFDDYFHIFPWERLPDDAVGIDVGCGSGRWSMMVAPRVGSLHLLDASAEALEVAKRNLAGAENVSFHHASVGDIPIENASLDFAFSLGVLHHVPDTTSAIQSVASKLKSGAPFLIYLYYSLDNRPWWFRLIWQVSNAGRLMISRLPTALRMLASQIIAVTVYWPFARFAAVVQRIGLPTSLIPLEAYKNLSFYTMRTDAYDRFCTALEKRFSKIEIATMLTDAGFERVSFSETVPYWCAVGYKR